MCGRQLGSALFSTRLQRLHSALLRWSCVRTDTEWFCVHIDSVLGGAHARLQLLRGEFLRRAHGSGRSTAFRKPAADVRVLLSAVVLPYDRLRYGFVEGVACREGWASFAC